VAEVVDFNNIDAVMSKTFTLGDQALQSYRTSVGLATELSPEMVYYRSGHTGGILNLAGAAFALENLGVGTKNWIQDKFTFFDTKSGFNNSQAHMDMLGNYKGYVDKFPELLSAESPEELEWVKAKILGEEENRAVLENLGFMEGLLYYFPAGLLSPENLLPFATALRGIGIGTRSVAGLTASRVGAKRAGVIVLGDKEQAVFTAAGLAMSRKARRQALIRGGVAKNTIPQIVGLSVAEGLLAGGVAEVVLRSQQGLRTNEELIFGIIGGGVFGGLLGGLGVAIGKGYRSWLNRVIGHEYLDDAVDDANAQYTRALVEKLEERGVDVGEVLEEVNQATYGDATLNAHKAWEEAIETISGEVSGPIRALAGFSDEAGWFSSILKKVQWFDPNIQVAMSGSNRVRELGAFFTSNPLIATRDRAAGLGMGESLALEGGYTRPSIESMLHLVELDAFGRISRVGGHFDDYKGNRGKLPRTGYMEAVARLNRRGESFDDIDITATKDDGSYHYPGHEALDPDDLLVLKQSLIKSAKEVRGFFDAIKGMAEQSGAFMRLRGEETMGNIVSYMAREYDIDKIRLNREGFLKVLMDGHNSTVEAKKAGLRDDIGSIQLDINTAVREGSLARDAGDGDMVLMWKEQEAASVRDIIDANKSLSDLRDADQRLAEQTIDGILGDGSVINGGNDSTVSARIKNFTERSIDINDVDLEDYLINDVDYLMGKMIRHTLPDLFLAEYLGSSKVSRLIRITEAQAKAVRILQERYNGDPSDEAARGLVTELASLRDNLNRLNLINAFRTAPEVTRDMSLDLVNELNEILGRDGVPLREGEVQLGMQRINELFDSSVEQRGKFNHFVDKVAEFNLEIEANRSELRGLALELADGSMYTSASESLMRAIGDGDIELGKSRLAELHALDVETEVNNRMDSDVEVVGSRAGITAEGLALEGDQRLLDLEQYPYPGGELRDIFAEAVDLEAAAERAKKGKPVLDEVSRSVTDKEEPTFSERKRSSSILLEGEMSAEAKARIQKSIDEDIGPTLSGEYEVLADGVVVGRVERISTGKWHTFGPDPDDIEPASDVPFNTKKSAIESIKGWESSTSIEAAKKASREFDASRDELIVNISAAVNDQKPVQLAELNRLMKLAEDGDAEAVHRLHATAREGLIYLFSGLDKNTARITLTKTTGFFKGDIEPSVEVQVEFRADAPEGRDQVLAALAKFGEAYNQKSFYEIRPIDEGTLLGHKYDDGSFNTTHYEWTMTRELSRTELDKIIEESGLEGLTQQEGKLTTYYSEGVDDVEALEKFESAANKADELIGGYGGAVEQATKRFGAYGDGGGGTPYNRLTVHFSPAKGDQASATAGRIATYLSWKKTVPTVQDKILTREKKALQKDIAAAFEAMPLNDLDNPLVLRAYQELADELLVQYESMTIKIESGSTNYADSPAMRRDVLENNHLYIYKTDVDSFGPEGSDYSGHPLLKPALDRNGVPITDMNGVPLVINDLLRAVHDYFAHTLGTASFGRLGEEAAWRNHMLMTRSPWARWALTSETRGQNSWVNFSEQNMKLKAEGVPRSEWPFSEQKVALLPVEFLLTGSSSVDASLLRLPGSEGLRDRIDTNPTRPEGRTLREFFDDQHSKATNENVLPSGEYRDDLGFDDSAADLDRIKKRVEYAKSVDEDQYLLGAVDEILNIQQWPARVVVSEIEGKGTMPSIKQQGHRLQNHIEAGEGDLADYKVTVDKAGRLRRKATFADGTTKSVKQQRVTHVHGKRADDLRKLPPNQHLSIIQGEGKFRYIDELELINKEIAALEAPPTDLSPKASEKVRTDLEKAIAHRDEILYGGVPARTTRGETSEKFLPAFLDTIEETMVQQAPATSDHLFELKPNLRASIDDLRQGIALRDSAGADTRSAMVAAQKSIAKYDADVERRRGVHQKKVAGDLSVEATIRDVMEDYVVGGDIGIATRDGAVAGAIYDKIATDPALRRSVDDDLLGRATPESVTRRASEGAVALSRLIVSKDLAVKARKKHYRLKADIDRRIFKVSRTIGEIKGGQRGHTPINYNYHTSLKTLGEFDGAKIDNAVRGVVGAAHIIRRNAFMDQTSLSPHNAVIDMEYRQKMDAATTTKEVDKLEATRNRDKKLLLTMISRLRNTDGFEGPEVAQKASRILRNYNYLRSMGGVVISSIPDVMMGISTAGMMNYGRAFAKTIRGEWMERGKHRDEMALLLWAGETVLGRNRSASVFDIERPYRRSASPGMMDKIDYSLGQHANTFSQLSGTNYWNGLMKGIAAVAIQSRIIQVSKKKAAGRSVSRSDQAFMNFIGMNDQAALDVAKIHESLADVTDEFMGHTFYYSGSERWKGAINGVSASRVDLARTTFQAAVHTGANNTILTPNAGVLAPELTTWWGRLFGQFRSFMAQSNETLVFSGGQRMLAARDMNVAITFVGLTFMGVLVYSLKEALLGRDALGDMTDEKMRVLLFNGLDRSGALAVPMEMNNITHSWLGGGGPINKAFGVSEEAGRYRERGMWGTLAAPLSAADDLYQGLGAFVNRGLDPDNELFKSDRKRLRRAIPYQNLWWLSVGLDVAPNMLDRGSFYDSNYRFEERMYQMIGGEPAAQGK